MQQNENREKESSTWSTPIRKIAQVVTGWIYLRLTPARNASKLRTSPTNLSACKKGIKWSRSLSVGSDIQPSIGIAFSWQCQKWREKARYLHAKHSLPESYPKYKSWLDPFRWRRDPWCRRHCRRCNVAYNTGLWRICVQIPASRWLGLHTLGLTQWIPHIRTTLKPGGFSAQIGFIHGYLSQEQVDKGSFVDEIENCGFIELDLHHMTTAEFASLG